MTNLLTKCYFFVIDSVAKRVKATHDHNPSRMILLPLPNELRLQPLP